MLGHVTGIPESLLAVLAFERLIARVNSHVYLQAIFTSVQFTAELAQVALVDFLRV